MQIRTFSKLPGLLLLILLTGIVLRLYYLTFFSLSNDELSALARLQYDSLSDVVRSGIYTDFHPAGVQIFLYVWTGIVGFGDFWVRLPFVLFGIGSVYWIYLTGKDWFGTNTGLLAASAMAALSFPLLYSQIARPYSPGLFFVLMLTYYWGRIFLPGRSGSLEEYENKRTDFLGVVIGLTGCMYTHYFAFLQSGLIYGLGFLFMSRKSLKPYLLAGIVAAILYVPHLDIFIHQLSKGGIGGPDGWLGPPEPDFFKKYLHWVINDSKPLEWIYLGTVAGFVLMNRYNSKFRSLHLTTLLLFLIPFAIGYYYSLYVNPVLQHSVLLFSFPFLLLFLFSFSSAPQESSKVNGIPVVILLCATVYSTVVDKDYYHQQHFSEFRKIASAATEINKDHTDVKVTNVINIHSPYYIHHYLDKDAPDIKFDIYRIQSEQEFDDFVKVVKHSKADKLFYAWSNMYNDPATEQVIRYYFPCLTDSANYLNSGYRVFQKAGENDCTDKEYLYYQTCIGNNPVANINHNDLYPDQIIIDENDEFTEILVYNFNDSILAVPRYVEVDYNFSVISNKAEANLVVSYESNGEQVFWKGLELSNYCTDQQDLNTAFLHCELPPIVTGKGLLKVYIWNNSKNRFKSGKACVRFYSFAE